jgi:hypothetical protein
MACQCNTAKGTPCRLSAQPGQKFCHIHMKKCTNPITSIIQVPRVPEGTIVIPPALAEKVAKNITTELNKSVSSTSSSTSTSTSDTSTSLKEKVEEVTAKTLDKLVEELGVEDVSDLVDLTPEEIDYFVGTILLHENKDKLVDIVNKKIEEQHLRDPHAILVLKSRELLEELAGKFCRCIKKTMEKTPTLTEGIAIAICRRSVINGKGLSFPRFACKTYPNPSDKSVYQDTPIFLPSKDRKKILSKHAGYLLYKQENVDGDLTKWAALNKAVQDGYLKR